MTEFVLPLPGNESFAERLAEHLGADQLPAEIRSFPDGESYVRLDGDCSGANVFVVSTFDQPDTKFLRTVYTALCAREQGAAKVILVAPYLGYMRQDKAFRPGEAVTANMFAKMLSPSIDGLITADPHLHRIEMLDDIYSVPAFNVHAAPAIADWVAERVENPVFVGPDVESKQWVSAVAAEIGAPFLALEKIRRGDHDVEISVPQLAEHKGRTPVIVDDIISTARTMVETVRHLHDLGTAPPVCVGVHAIFAGDAYKTLQNAGAAMIATTNSVPHESNEIDVSGLVANACHAMVS